MGRIGKLLLMFLIISVPSFAAGKPIIKYEGSSTVGLFIRDAAKVYKKADIEISRMLKNS